MISLDLRFPFPFFAARFPDSLLVVGRDEVPENEIRDEKIVNKRLFVKQIDFNIDEKILMNAYESRSLQF